jgi:hypothetical protein
MRTLLLAGKRVGLSRSERRSRVGSRSDRFKKTRESLQVDFVSSGPDRLEGEAAPKPRESPSLMRNLSTVGNLVEQVQLRQRRRDLMAPMRCRGALST